jgi:pyruvate dehydrogenase E2 component (dihydrolipoamide acetyltransferase)
MASEILMPRMGLTMETGRIVSWLKQEGQTVKAGEPLLEIETDKATVEIESLESGMLGKIVAGFGEEIPVGGVIGYLLKDGETLAKDMRGAIPATTGNLPVSNVSDTSAETQANPAFVTTKVKASPAARHLAQQLGVSLAQVNGSGPNGRIVAWNVTEAAQSAAKTHQPDSGRISPLARRVAADLGVDLTLVKGSGLRGVVTRRDVELAGQTPGRVSAVETAAGDSTKIEPFTRIQRVMAERMMQSFSTAPHFYLHVEVDARQMVALRGQLLPRLEKRDSVHLTFTDLLIYFCARTLPKHSLVMAQWTTEGLKRFSRVHIGIAVETENGLIVPVLRDADKLGLVEIARQRVDLAERARQSKLLPNEFEEGVFTITNLGMYHIDSFDAILNPPQAAILAVGQIKERALVENGQLVPAAMVNLSLSVDHRVLDGARGARFLNELVEMIETPGLSMA